METENTESKRGRSVEELQSDFLAHIEKTQDLLKDLYEMSKDIFNQEGTKADKFKRIAAMASKKEELYKSQARFYAGLGMLAHLSVLGELIQGKHDS